MEKTITIDVPEGYEIDKEKSTFEQIVFKKKGAKPRSWDEFIKNYKYNGEYLFEKPGSLEYAYCDTEEEYESFLALMKLRLLRKSWVEDWNPDYKDNNTLKWSIYFYQDKPKIIYKYGEYRTLSFPKEEMARDFVECFRDLIEKAKILL